MNTCPRCSESFDSDVRFCPVDGQALESVVDPHVGQRLLGQFELREAIGKGAMGTVYRAWQHGVERWVAVKVLHAGLARDAAVVKRFAREARAVARLSHPNIVTVFVVGDTGEGLPCLVMEYVEGELLEQAIADEPMPAERAVRIARQIASALADAHAAGIVHRDLKPANVALTQRRRAADFVKVLDFGIAKFVGGAVKQGESAITRDGAIFGTPHYLSPEQATGSAIDHRADIYSLGVMLYRMVCGRLPFPGRGVSALLAHVNNPVPPLREAVADLDPRLETIILRCLEKDPAARYESAEQLADALDALAGSALTPWASGIRYAAPRLTAPADARTIMVSEGTPPASGVQRTVIAAPGQLATGGRPAFAGVAPLSPPPPAYAPTPAVARPGTGPFGTRAGTERAPSSRDLAVVPPPRWAARIALALALVVAGAGAGVGVYLLRGTAARSVALDPQAPPVAIAGPVSEAAAVATRTVIVSEAGYAIRAALPERMVVGVEYEMVLETWDPSGEPLVAPEIVVTIEEPGGIERGLAAKLTDRPGRYRFTRGFQLAGTHYLHVYPPRGNTNVTVWFDVAAAGPSVAAVVPDAGAELARSVGDETTAPELTSEAADERSAAPPTHAPASGPSRARPQPAASGQAPAKPAAGPRETAAVAGPEPDPTGDDPSPPSSPAAPPDDGLAPLPLPPEPAIERPPTPATADLAGALE